MNILTQAEWEGILSTPYEDTPSWNRFYQAILQALLPSTEFPLMNDWILQAFKGHEGYGSRLQATKQGEAITSKWREDAAYRQRYMNRIRAIESLLSHNRVDGDYYTEPGIYVEVGLPNSQLSDRRRPKFDIAGLEVIFPSEVWTDPAYTEGYHSMKYKGFGFYPVRWRPLVDGNGITLDQLQGNTTILNVYQEEYGDEATVFLPVAYLLTYQDYLDLLKPNSLLTLNFPQGL